MKHIKLFRALLTCLFISVYAGSLHAVPILLSEGVTSSFSYGKTYWDNMTDALDAASGNSVDVTSDFTDLTQMLSYDALWLSERALAGSLSTIEIDNLTAYIATGRRVVMQGENDLWTDWNNQILGIVGGSFDTTYTGDLTAVISNELTAGVNTIYGAAAGVAVSGGTSLFDQNVVTLWGSGNVLTMLDTNICDDFKWGLNDNATFCGNVASWITASAPVTEPSLILLLGSGLALLGFMRRKA